MKENWLKRYPARWLMAGILALATLTLAFQDGDSEVDPAHYPHPTATPTLTPTPTLQACQVQQIFFDDQLYTPGTTVTGIAGTPLKVTLRVADAQGAPLIGANVDATVTQINDVQAAAIPPLEDQSGTYDGLYTPPNPGTYVLKFSVSDFTGPRFLPCSATRTVQVKEVPQCSISLEAAPLEVEVNTPINLTATITNTLCTSVTTNIQLPGDGVRPLPTPLVSPGPANICTGSYTPTFTGTYTFTATAVDALNRPCASTPVPVRVIPTVTPTPTPTIDLKFPSQTIDLCRLTDPIAATLAISNVTGLTGVEIEITYDKSFIQVIDAFGPPRPPLQQVEVKPDPNFDPWLRNETDIGQGIIYFTANTHTPVTGHSNIIYINWQPQGREGNTTLNFTTVFTHAQGSKTISGSSPLTITVGPPCRTGFTSLQGRTDHSGVTVTGTNGEQARSYPNGLFAIATTGPFNFTFPGYLPAQADLPQSAAASAAITLLAGDVNSDNIINILDMTYLAGRYLSTDATADLNGDGTVNILDLTLVAGNYQHRGPLTSWQ